MPFAPWRVEGYLSRQFRCWLLWDAALTEVDRLFAVALLVTVSLYFLPSAINIAHALGHSRLS